MPYDPYIPLDAKRVVSHRYPVSSKRVIGLTTGLGFITLEVFASFIGINLPSSILRLGHVFDARIDAFWNV